MRGDDFMARQKAQLPGNIRNGLKYLNDRDERGFLKKCQGQSSDTRLLAHTRIELIPGVFGAMMGYTPRYEPKMEGQTPDWLFLNMEGKPHFFGEVVSFHMNDIIEKSMEEALEIDDCWFGELPGSEERLYWVIKNEKITKYRELADTVDLPFVLFVYGWFEAFLHSMELRICLTDREYGLFKDYPQLSGIYHFDDAAPLGREVVDPRYDFRFYASPNASRPLMLPDGLVPLPIPDPAKLRSAQVS
jgi:hypothetical protein